MFDVVLNPALQKFDNFAEEAMNDPVLSQKSEVSRLSVNRHTGEVTVVKSTTDSCFRLGRPKHEQVWNNATRMGFFNAVVAQFGGVDKIPQSVREAMAQEDFGDVSFEASAKNDISKFNTGKPLRAYRIQQILNAVKKEIGVYKDSVKSMLNDLLHVNDSNDAQDAMRATLENFFKSVLPPKWNRSRNLDFNALEDEFGTRNIKELQDKIFGTHVSTILAQAMNSEVDKAAQTIQNTLNALEKVFNNPAKKQHVHQIVDVFSEILDPAALWKLQNKQELDITGNLRYNITGKTAGEIDGAALACQLKTTGSLESLKSCLLERLASCLPKTGNPNDLQKAVEAIANIGLSLPGDASVSRVADELKNALQSIQEGDALDALGDRRDEFLNLLKGVCKGLDGVKAELDAAEEYEIDGGNEANAVQKNDDRLIPLEEEEEIDTRMNRPGAAEHTNVTPLRADEIEAAKRTAQDYGSLISNHFVTLKADPTESEVGGLLKGEIKRFAEQLVGNELLQSDRDKKFIEDLQDAFSTVSEYPVALKLMRQYCDGLTDARQKLLCRVKIDAFKAAYDEVFDSALRDKNIKLDDYVETLGREYGVLERTPEALVQFLTEKLTKIFPNFAYVTRGGLRDRLPEIARDILAGGPARDQALSELQKGVEARLKWDNVSKNFDPKTAKKIFTGICEILKTGLSPAQQAFIKSEIKAYRDWYNQFLKAHENPKTHKSRSPTLEEIAQWKFSKAIDPEYQEKVFRLFGNQLSPVQVEDAPPTALNPCLKNDFLAMGEGKGESLPQLTENMPGVGGFQIAADATYFGGTWQGGQEEGLLIDLPAFSIALLARQGYIEPAHMDKNTGVATLVTDGDSKKINRWRYTLDEKGERKLKTWLGVALPSFTFSANGKPIAGDDVKLNWYVFTAASGFGYGRANIDRGGFLEALRHRPTSRLDTEDKRINANSFFSKLDYLVDRLNGDYKFLNDKELVGYGLDDDQKNYKGNGKKWGEMMFLAHFYVGPEFDVFAADTDVQFDKLLNLIKNGNYREKMEQAIANYEKTLKFQADLWAKLFGKLKLNYAVCTTPGGSNFANPRGMVIKYQTQGIARLGGNVQYYLHKYYSTSPVDGYSNAFKQAAKSIVRKVKNILGRKSNPPAV